MAKLDGKRALMTMDRDRPDVPKGAEVVNAVDFFMERTRIVCLDEERLQSETGRFELTYEPQIGGRRGRDGVLLRQRIPVFVGFACHI